MLDALLADPVAQGIGLAGTLGGMAWPLFRSRVGILLAQLFTNACFTVHYGLLGADTGCLMNLLSVVQVACAIPLGARPGFRYAYLAVLPVIALALVLTWQGLPSALAAVGAALVSIARYQTDVRPLRLFMGIAILVWFGHNFLVGSVPGMISDVVGFVLNGLMLARALPRRSLDRPLPGL